MNGTPLGGREKRVKMMKKRVMAALLAALMALCVVVAAPRFAAAEDEEPKTPDVQAQTIDELIAAIGPNVTVALAPGQYDLASAASYGKDTGNPYCRWEPASEQGYELWISGVEGLTLQGAGLEKTTILAEDRYASVLCFDNCRNLMVGELTAGHSPLPGYCSGGVLRLTNDSDVMVAACGLFGCGTEGVWASNCIGLTVIGTRIYECSDSALSADSCYDLRVMACQIDHNGWKGAEGASCLFRAYGGNGFTVTDCRIHDNTANLLFQCTGTRGAAFLSNYVEYNVLSSVFALYDLPATVDGCSFHENSLGSWYAEGYGQPTLAAHDPEGKALSGDSFSSMTHHDIELPEAEGVAGLQPPTDVPAGAEIRVRTADEFLAALGPDRTILVEGEGFSLADAADYGNGIGWYYHWEQCYDGPQLVLSGLMNLTIRSASPEDAITLTAVPRYADVLCFKNCENVRIQDLTLGHSEGSSECAGAVLTFEACNGMSVERCFLYGCGTLGVNAWSGSGLELTECEIYDCSIGGVVLGSIQGVTFENCRIHDVPSPAISLYGCQDVRWNGAPVLGEHYDVTPEGALQPVSLI